MRPRIEDSIGDDAMASCGYLQYTDETLKSSFLQSLHTMRKHRLFCDVILHVGSSEIHAHRNVLACVSPHLMEMFSADMGNGNGLNSANGESSIPSYRLNGYINKIGLQFLVEYAYTAMLEVPDDMVKDVYLAAWQLRMDRVVTECARHLIAELSFDTCIDIRSLPGINKNKNFVQEVDAFIFKEFEKVAKTPDFLTLSCVQIEVLYQSKQEMALVTENSLCRLVLDWVKRQMKEDNLTMQQLLERSHMLYLGLDNSLQDCSDLPPGQEADSEIVQDYKRLVLKCPSNKSRRKCVAAAQRPRLLIYSRDIGERNDEQEEQDLGWEFIASAKLADHSFVSLVTLDGVLTRTTVHLRLNVSTTPSPVNTPAADSVMMNSYHELSGDPLVDGLDAQPELFCELGAMSGPKCGLGVAELNGKLLVCGGYDRAQCLQLVESYCPDTNEWVQETSMREKRGRVQIAVINETVYAVGGCNGTNELDTVECLPKSETKWKKCCKLPLARSNAGVCTLNDKLYCVGGWNGQTGIKQCDVFEPAENTWTSIAPMNTGRYQAGVAAYLGQVWVVGGSDAWNCLSSSEIYDPASNTWSNGPTLLSPRRGCGLAAFSGKLYVVGGSDGNHSLSTTEVYDEASQTWVAGPSLTTARANVSAVVVRDKLYAIGGFSGKTFLNTIEYLDPTSNEWTTFVHTKQNSKIKSILDLSLQQLALMQQNSFDDADENVFHETETDDEIKNLTGFKHQNGNGASSSPENTVAIIPQTNGHHGKKTAWKSQKGVNDTNGYDKIIDVQEHIRNISLDLDES